MYISAPTHRSSLSRRPTASRSQKLPLYLLPRPPNRHNQPLNQFPQLLTPSIRRPVVSWRVALSCVWRTLRCIESRRPLTSDAARRGNSFRPTRNNCCFQGPCRPFILTSLTTISPTGKIYPVSSAMRYFVLRTARHS